jgi:hypothetical protein
MTGVVAALEANDDIRLLRQPVDDLALSLVAPLGTDDDNVGHFAGIPYKGEARLSTPNSKFVSLCSGLRIELQIRRTPALMVSLWFVFRDRLKGLQRK